MSFLFQRLMTVAKNGGSSPVVSSLCMKVVSLRWPRTEFVSTASNKQHGNAGEYAPANEQEEPDELYKRLQVEVRGHDQAVLKSYEWFATTAAKHLEIDVTRTWVPDVVKIRRRALKSAFAHGKHIVQYEFRTYFRVMEFKHVTGSTADTFLEYIQRNLPEGVAMKVTKERIEKIPEHIRPPAPASTNKD